MIRRLVAVLALLAVCLSAYVLTGSQAAASDATPAVAATYAYDTVAEQSPDAAGLLHGLMGATLAGMSVAAC